MLVPVLPLVPAASQVAVLLLVPAALLVAVLLLKPVSLRLVEVPPHLDQMMQPLPSPQPPRGAMTQWRLRRLQQLPGSSPRRA